MQTVKVDTKGKDCPIPLIELKKAISQIDVNDVVEVEFTCPEATTNLPNYAAEQGYEVLEYKELNEGPWSITIKKTK